MSLKYCQEQLVEIYFNERLKDKRFSDNYELILHLQYTKNFDKNLSVNIYPPNFASCQ